MGQFIHRQTQEKVIQDFARYVSPGRVAVYEALGFAVVPGRREGVRLWDLEGHSYINCHASAGGFNLGHRPPRVIKALRRAMDELDIGDHILMSEHRAALAKRLAQLRELSNIGQLARMTFESFVPDGRHALNPKKSKNLRQAYELAREFAENPTGWLVFLGGYGCGKTHLAAAIASYRIGQAQPALFVVVPDLLDHIRATFGPESPVSYDERLRRSALPPCSSLMTWALSPPHLGHKRSFTKSSITATMPACQQLSPPIAD